MQLLLDTHALVWWLRNDARLSSAARTAIAEPDAVVHVSAASAWEIVTKVRLNKMPEMVDYLPRYESDLLKEGFRSIAIGQRHGLRAGSLPGPHGDPFDRMIAAQALLDDFTIVTRDRAFAAFGCEVIW